MLLLLWRRFLHAFDFGTQIIHVSCTNLMLTRHALILYLVYVYNHLLKNTMYAIVMMKTLNRCQRTTEVMARMIKKYNLNTVVFENEYSKIKRNVWICFSFFWWSQTILFMNENVHNVNSVFVLMWEEMKSFSV